MHPQKVVTTNYVSTPGNNYVFVKNQDGTYDQFIVLAFNQTPDYLELHVDNFPVVRKRRVDEMELLEAKVQVQKKRCVLNFL